MQKALVTGANGFIGSALTRRLLHNGYAVRAMCRSAERGKALVGAEVVEGDIQDLDTTRRHATGCDVIFHLAAVGAGSAVHQHNINVQGTLNVIQAGYESGIQRFVHVSSIAVYGYDLWGTIDETYPQHPPPNDFYMVTKSQGEKAVWDYAERVGLPTVTVRPAFVYGAGGTLWTQNLYKLCSTIPIPLLAGGRGSAHPIYVDDVVDLLVTAATHPDAPGHAFHAAPDPAPTWGEFLGYYGRMADNARTITISLPPTFLLKPIANAVSVVGRLMDQPFEVYGAIMNMTRTVTFSMAQARNILGWQPHFDLETGMALTEAWLKGDSALKDRAKR
ncbi:MAG: NAD-dependent epimerase/dehydratase family protein [Chloroflexota bacterium]